MNTISDYFFYYLLTIFVMQFYWSFHLFFLNTVTATILSYSSHIQIGKIISLNLLTIWTKSELKISWKLLGVFWLKVAYPKILFNDDLGLGNISLSLHYYFLIFFFHSECKNSQYLFILCIIIDRISSVTSKGLIGLLGFFFFLPGVNILNVL